MAFLSLVDRPPPDLLPMVVRVVPSPSRAPCLICLSTNIPVFRSSVCCLAKGCPAAQDLLFWFVLCLNGRLVVSAAVSAADSAAVGAAAGPLPQNRCFCCSVPACLCCCCWASVSSLCPLCVLSLSLHFCIVRGLVCLALFYTKTFFSFFSLFFVCPYFSSLFFSFLSLCFKQRTP